MTLHVLGAFHALVVTLLIEVPIAAALFPKQRARIALVALVANAITNLTLNVLLPRFHWHETTRIVVGETFALVGEALAYALASKPREVGRAIVAASLGNGLSFALGPVIARALW